MTEPAIEAKNISYSYGDLLAVNNISFKVAPGETLGFLGPNGAGKTTTIKMLTGQLVPKTGTVKILGKKVTKESPEIQGQIGVCFEEKNLYENMTALENLNFFAKLFGIKDVDSENLLRRVGLAGRENDRVKKFSKGMKQRLMVARTIVNRPRILFLDEPTDGLDPVSSQAIRKIIREEAEKGVAIFLTTHDMHEADELSDRVAFINEGKIVTMDTPENLKLKYGSRSVKIRKKENGETVEKVVPLDEEATGEKLKEEVATKDLISIHTEEATLENIFIQLTGRGLEE